MFEISGKYPNLQENELLNAAINWVNQPVEAANCDLVNWSADNHQPKSDDEFFLFADAPEHPEADAIRAAANEKSLNRGVVTRDDDNTYHVVIRDWQGFYRHIGFWPQGERGVL